MFSRFRISLAWMLVISLLTIGAVRAAPTAAAPGLTPDNAYCQIGGVKKNLKTAGSSSMVNPEDLATIAKTGAQECLVSYGQLEVTYVVASDVALQLQGEGIFKTSRLHTYVVTTAGLKLNLPAGDYKRFFTSVFIAGDNVNLSAQATPLTGAIYFQQTGHNLSSGFLAYWQKNGGLTQFGFPLTEVFWQDLGGAYQVQYFERARFEYHPENAAPYDILLGQFGRDVAQGHGVPTTVIVPGKDQTCTLAEETGHYICDRFLAYWQTNGGLPQYGFPLTDVVKERLGDGKVYQVQYFERARFEYHPENAAPYDILLGQFGRDILSYFVSLRQTTASK